MKKIIGSWKKMTKEYEMEYTREDELLERISELEKKNKELKDKYHKVSDEREKLLSEVYKKSELVSVNELLKKRVILLHERCGELILTNTELKEKLTTAKEIIKRLMDIINHDLKCFDTIAGLDVKQKAKQFLKECE